MLKQFTPTWIVESVFDLDFKKMKEAGITTILSDLDNTLIAWNNPESTVEARLWTEELKKEGFNLMIVSNNNRDRIQVVAEALEVPFISRAMKPLTFALSKARSEFKVPKEQVVMIGDQLMTDIQAANYYGIKSILVKPIVETDAKTTAFNRFVERQLKKMLEKKHGNQLFRRWTINEDE